MWLVKFILLILWCQVSVLQRTEIKTEDFDCSKSTVPIPCNWRYLTYFPNLFRTGSFENVVVLTHGFKNQVVVNITLYDNINKKSYLSKFFNIQPEILNTLPIYIDHNAPSSLNLFIEGRGKVENDIWVFKNQSDLISVLKLGLNVFVQTDRPVYKPGQTIKCRVVVVNTDLKPHKGRLKVTIENPSGTRMQQWNDVELDDGFSSFELPTSEKPVMGVWKIKAEIDGYSKTTQVEVKEYVLPKFQVTIIPPGYISKITDEFDTEVCAKYSYGKSVIGLVTAQICQVVNQYWESKEKCIEVVKKIDGCASFKTLMSSLFIQKTIYSWVYTKITFHAQVKEDATGISLNSSVITVNMVNNPIKLSFEGSNIFKPGFPLAVKLLASYVDNTPVKSVVVNISAGTNGYSSSDLLFGEFLVKDGSLNVALPEIPFNAQKIDIRAIYKRPKRIQSEEYDYERTVTANKVIDAWYSPSHSYLFIEKPKAPVKNGSDAKVIVHYTSVDDLPINRTIFYSLVCAGNIQLSGVKSVLFRGAASRTQLGVFFTPSLQNASSVHLTSLGQKIITDSNNGTNKSHVFNNFSLNWWTTKKSITRPPLPLQYTKSHFNISFPVTSKMMPLCHMLVYYLYGNEVVADNVDIKVVNEFENKFAITFDNKEVRPGDNVKLTIKGFPKSRVAIVAIDKSVHFLAQGNDIKLENLIKIREDLDLYPKHVDDYKRCGWGKKKRKSVDIEYYSQHLVDSEIAFANTGVQVYSSLHVDTRPCSSYIIVGSLTGEGEYEMVSDYEDITIMDSSLRKQSEKLKKVESKPITYSRTNLPETWLWTEERLSENGTHVFDVKVPDTITSWYASGFAVSSSAGLGVAVPSELRVFQSFFVSLVLPYSVIRREIVSVPVAIFSYVDEACVTVHVTLEFSVNYNIIGSPNTKVCVCGGSTATVYFKIQPTAIGKISIQVSAKTLSENVCAANQKFDSSISLADILLKKLLVEPEGLKQEYTFSNFFCPKSYPEQIFKYSFNLTLPENLVKDSVFSKITVVGDIMGSSLDNIDSLLEMPSGCGEQNMLKFAPNIFIMKYLQNTKQVNNEIKTKALNFMRTGYQRELTYKRGDGSYSAFGINDKEGSTWLTAFVLKSYAQAQPLIDIDKKEIQDPINWLFQKQDFNGCFSTIGMLHNKAMKGGVTSPVTLTAYVVISLLEANIHFNHSQLMKASKCVKDSLSAVTDTYSLAIIAYMYAKLQDYETYQSVIDTLNKLAIYKDGMVHWEETKKQEATKEPWYYQARSTDIEQTAYVVLAMLTYEKSKAISDVVPIVQWLSKQRNSLGGWSSTQDTVLAMQALSEFAEYSFGAAHSMNVTVKTADRFEHTFEITQGNSLVSQHIEDFSVPTTVNVVATGEGCSLLQTSVQYNVKEVTLKPSFQLTSTVKPVNEAITAQQLCKPQNIKVCAYYTGVGDSNMAIIDIQMVSGFEPNKESLDKLLVAMNRVDYEPTIGFESASTIKDIELIGKSAIFYFDKISNNGSCVKFQIDQTSKVEKTKPAAIKVYDYYDTGKSATIFYDVSEKQCHL